MKLDPRIKKGKMPLTPFELNKAKKFIGEFGYFANSLALYADLSNIEERGVFTLNSIDSSDTCIRPFTDDIEHSWSYFLPKAWTRPHEEMYGPYTLAGWCNRHKLGEVIVMRLKNTPMIEHHKIFVGCTSSTIPTITLGNNDFSFRELFEEWEIRIDNVWQPFGMKEYKEDFEE